jgi:hypothetical protein
MGFELCLSDPFMLAFLSNELMLPIAFEYAPRIVQG